MDEGDTNDVVQTVVESEGLYLLAKRSSDGFWEFMGGKVKEDENLKEAALRELNEETGLNISREEVDSFRRGDSYRSSANESFRLNPVYFEIDSEKRRSMTEEGLSNEHTDFSWIDITEFDEYDTLGQYQALEHLEIVNGRVALAAVRNNGKILLVQRSEENSTPGKWGLVSGGMEAGEEPEETAVRELREETGLKAEPVDKGDFFIGEGELGYWRLEPVLMEYVDGEVDLNWELSQHEWLKPQEILEKDRIGQMKGLEKLGVIEDGDG